MIQKLATESYIRLGHRITENEQNLKGIRTNIDTILSNQDRWYRYLQTIDC